MASVLVMTFFRSIVTPGMDRGRAPVARMTCLDFTTSTTLPSFETSIVERSLNLASPYTTSILFFFIRYSTPFEIRSATPRLRCMIFEKSKVRSLYEKPNSSAFLNCWYISALFSSAFDGMQPQFRQTPPSLSRSIRPTFLPLWAARIAAT